MKESEAREHLKYIPMFSSSEIEQATNNLDKSLKIGEGEFGIVYKGFLRHTTVAIKKHKLKGPNGYFEFNNEVENLREVRHPNIITLIGVCMEAHALIFEYMPNGSLDTYLNKNNCTPPLCWKIRMRIVFEICSVLVFLHSIKPHGMAHGDIRPENILLDSNYSIKLSEFSICHRLFLEDDDDTPYIHMDNPLYNPAYTAPEFFSTAEMTAQCDVYAFGIILLQLVTGRDPLELNNYVQQAVEGERLDSIIDSSAGNWPFEEAKKLIILGLRCSNPKRGNRPDLVTDVWKEIEFMKNVADEELFDTAKQLMSALDIETQRRIEIEKTLEEERINQQNLEESKTALEIQLVNSKNLLEATRKRHEELETDLRDELLTVKKESMNISLQHKKNLESLRIEQQKLLDSKAALELQVEQLQIERGNAFNNVKGLPCMRSENFTEFTWAELQEATNNFANTCKIGEGAFGIVFKGFLRYTNVAIKMLKSESSEGDIEFNQEVEILTKVRHPNLVSLLGVNPNARALVFEFVPNSLDTFLTGGKNSELSWQDRIRIASEICSALIFLHSVPPCGIAHGDLKPQNILLDSNYVSKLCDFGISRKLYQTDETFTPLHLTTIPKFTPAYCAPEFFASNELTPLCDIYSFGIILLQLVTGTDALKIKNIFGEDPDNCKLDKLHVDSAAEWPIKEAAELAMLGWSCSHPLKIKRPNLAKVVWPSLESMKRVADLC